MTERERKEVERLERLDSVDPGDRHDCAHYRCLQPAGNCYGRQTTTSKGRNRGAVETPQDPYCASGECPIGNLVAEKLTEKVEGKKSRVAGMTLRRGRRPKAKRRSVEDAKKPKERRPMEGAAECRADDCTRRIRRDNQSGVCYRCSQKAPWKWRLETRAKRPGKKPRT